MTYPENPESFLICGVYAGAAGPCPGCGASCLARSRRALSEKERTAGRFLPGGRWKNGWIAWKAVSPVWRCMFSVWRWTFRRLRMAFVRKECFFGAAETVFLSAVRVGVLWILAWILWKMLKRLSACAERKCGRNFACMPDILPNFFRRLLSVLIKIDYFCWTNRMR